MLSNHELIFRAGTIMWDTAYSSLQGSLLPPPELLYHYTNGVGLMGILGGLGRPPQLWATHAAYLNDPREGQEFRPVFEEAVRGLTGRRGSLPVTTEEQHLHLLQELTGGSWWQLYKSFYVVSFTEQADHLGQWRLYGADGAGFALGCRPEILKALGTEGGVRGNLLPVIYDAKLKNELARRLAEEIAKSVPTLEEALPDIFRHEAADRLLRTSVMYAVGLAEKAVGVAFKADGYASECEWRLVFPGFDPIHLDADRVVPQDIQQELSSLQFRASGTMIIPYLSAPVPEPGLLVGEIVVGPRQAEDLSRRSLNAFLAARNMFGPDRCSVRLSRHEYSGR